MAKRIGTYKPRNIKPETWERVRGTVTAWVANTEPHSEARAYHLFAVATRHAAWCTTRGIPLDGAHALHPDVIEQFVVEGCAHMTDRGRSTYRSHLRAIAKADPDSPVDPGEVAPRIVGLSAVPYTEDETAAHWSWANAKGEGLRQELQKLVGFSLAAGLAVGDIRFTLNRHVERLDDGTVLVHVQGRRPRTVPILRRWEPLLWPLVEGADPDAHLFWPSVDSRSAANLVSNVVRRHTPAGRERFAADRARSTWIVYHLAARTDIPLLAEAAGFAGPRNLYKYLSYVPVPDGPASSVHRLFRDAEPRELS